MFELTTKTADDVATIEFYNPEKANALTPELCDALAREITKVSAGAHVVTLRGRGKIFCAGVDLEYIREFGNPALARATRELVYGSFQGLMRAIRYTEIPVIACIRGGALGAGADLALNCDLRVAAESAWISESWISLGAISALGGTQIIRDATSTGTAMDIFLTGRRLDSVELYERGLVQRKVADSDLDEAVSGLARQIARQDRTAVCAVKRLIREATTDASWDANLTTALDLQVELICREAFQARVDEILRGLKDK